MNSQKPAAEPKQIRESLFLAATGLRSIPVGAVEALRLLHASEVDLGALAGVIEKDPGWTANILRLANSAYFGCRKSVATVKDAFVRLGMRTVYDLVVGSAFLPLFHRGTRPGEMDTLARHSLAVGAVAKELAIRIDEMDPEHIFTSGILHDVGKIVMDQATGTDQRRVIDSAEQRGIRLHLAEYEILGVDHAELGAFLLKQWQLPDLVVRVTRSHHEPDSLSPSSPAVDLVHLVDSLVSVELDEERDPPFYCVEGVCDRLGIGEVELKRASERLESFL